MTNVEKYDSAFIETFEIDRSDLTDELEYQSIPSWDSVGHMALIAELEDLFDISIEMDDVIDFGSYKTGFKTLEKYGVKF
ncbi:acyl carrier protein [Salinispirillum marinum]|uniref:Acyl carrier protein n=2 Tax=Saccharospirillaceae TaxID=255527 RepID=A0ABV8BFZ3_9GAMM